MCKTSKALTLESRRSTSVTEWDKLSETLVERIFLQAWGSTNQLLNGQTVITTSLIDDIGIDELETTLEELFFTAEKVDAETAYVSNVRHIHLLQQSKQALQEARDALELDMPLDMVQIDVRRTWEFLGEIIGDTASDSLIDQLFSQFCLGK